jgi:FtsH-binding integral membrane protein
MRLNVQILCYVQISLHSGNNNYKCTRSKLHTVAVFCIMTQCILVSMVPTYLTNILPPSSQRKWRSKHMPFQNISFHMPDYTMQQPRRQYKSSSPSKVQILRMLFCFSEHLSHSETFQRWVTKTIWLILLYDDNKTMHDILFLHKSNAFPQ